MLQIIVYRGATLLVSLALAPSFRATSAGSPRQTRLDGPFGSGAHLVVGAAAVLQSRSVFGQIELDERGNAMARALLPLPGEHGATCAHVMFVRVFALGFGLAVHDGLPAYQPPAVGRRGHREVAKNQKHTTKRPNRSTDAL